MIKKLTEFINKYIKVFVLIWLVLSLFFLIDISRKLKTVNYKLESIKKSVESSVNWSRSAGKGTKFDSSTFGGKVLEQLDTIEFVLRSLR